MHCCLDDSRAKSAGVSFCKFSVEVIVIWRGEMNGKHPYIARLNNGRINSVRGEELLIHLNKNNMLGMGETAERERE